MAAIDNTRLTHGNTGLAGFTFAGLLGGLAAWNDARLTRKALSSLSDRELEDIGLVRGDIDTVIGGKRQY
jgi:uncharacterized protein YjiS (DUF1127 family)